jgi:UDP-N-acetylglucosamine 2-epimerase
MRTINVTLAKLKSCEVAPLMAADKDCASIEPLFVHADQQYDEEMSEVFLRQLGIPEPATSSDVGGGSHAKQTVDPVEAFEPVLLEHKRDAVVVVRGEKRASRSKLVLSRSSAEVILHDNASLRGSLRGPQVS